MYFLLTLFFISLLGITFMIGRKLVMLQNGQVLNKEEIIFRTPDFEEWRHLTVKNLKKYGYIGLVMTIRFYVRSMNMLKAEYQDAKTKLKNLHSKHLGKSEEKREVSKFLTMISDYKHKIREIKHKIKEEEKL